MKSREVARARSLPVGGSVGSDAGQQPNPVGIDHTHSFWGKWILLPLLRPWIGNVYYSMCGNVVWLRGSADADNPFINIYDNPNVLQLPIEARPTYNVFHVDQSENLTFQTIVNITTAGYVRIYNTEDIEDLSGNLMTSNFNTDDCIYRTFV